ncbi:glycosyltransferase [Sphingomonas melonis]|uniref:UDP:flavonoid glycosyltransferase YjiC (YdhE family) n=1 Tax=Sphingomonas melonis TaxID=152682 RepID=A0A7Y9FJN7_9SPHN|nr:glycosyltransferase [Sphingomonas melonis]NYD88514.1 UDP:flavonoid glycosyltransferase YjiC (YdhE family) [Sphingomonas melonis]
MKAILMTIGSLGDLHPFIAIGRALATRGVEVVLAVPADHVETVQAAGLAAAAILPSFADICTRLGVDEATAAQRVITQRSFVLDAVILPSLADSTAALDRLAQGADVIVGSLFALAAGIVAEKRGLPLVAINLQPMALFSAWDPPQTPECALLVHAPGGPLGRAWNRALLAAVKAAVRARYGGGVEAVRRAHGLPPSRRAPLFDPAPAQGRTLCCYSPLLAAVQPDAPARSEAIGFPVFDGAGEDGHAADPALVAFLDRGPPPIAFTLGSFLVRAPGRFYETAAAAARAVGQRAVLLTGRAGDACDEGDVLRLGYAPHSHVFGRAAAVVHHGGIGTTGQAMRAGVPQLVLPFFGDQFDNGARVARLGIGRTMRPAAFCGQAAGPALRALLDDTAMAQRAAAVAVTVRGERPTAIAVERIVTAVREAQSARIALSGALASASRAASGAAPASTSARPCA